MTTTTQMSLEDLHRERNFEVILSRFEKFLGRYQEIFNPRSPTRKIVNLARNSTDLHRTLIYLTHTGDAGEVHQMRSYIMKAFGKEEMDQVCYLAFLEVLNRFDPTRGVPLEKFIYNYYPYLYSTEVVKLAGPRQKLNEIKLQDELFDEEVDSSSPRYTEAALSMAASSLTNLYNNNDLGYEWVEGAKCDELFMCLSSLERKIIYCIYVEDMTQEEIASELKYHHSSIKRKKKEIIDKLSTRIAELEEQWD